MKLDYYIEIRDCAPLFGSNRRVNIGRGQFRFDQSPSRTQQHFLTATEYSRARDQNISQHFGREHANASVVTILVSKYEVKLEYHCYI